MERINVLPINREDIYDATNINNLPLFYIKGIDNITIKWYKLIILKKKIKEGMEVK
jgi:hypothetical protein